MLYREPLVLFYRDQRSTREIAGALDLPPETVRQRISRGRKLLRDEVAGLVEETLRKTTPGPVFTAGVMAVLPAIDASMRLGAGGAVAGKGLAALKSAAATSATIPWIGSLVVMGLNLVLGRRNIRLVESSLSNAGRARLRRYRRDSRLLAGGFFALFLALIAWTAWAELSLLVLFSLMNAWLVALVAALFLRARLDVRERRAEAAALSGAPNRSIPLVVSEHRSGLSLFGLPLVHLVHHRRGGTEGERRAPVRAWIAAAPLFGPGPKRAYGILYAQGRFACAPLSLGLVALGALPVGLCSAGLLAVGALAAGWWSIGWVAAGRDSLGVFAAGSTAAKGLWAWAGRWAAGGGAFGPHVNDAAAKAFFRSNLFFRTTAAFLHHNGLLYLSILMGLFALWGRRPLPTRRRRN